MSRPFRFSLRVTLTCGILAASMLGMSRWQWHRHLWKQGVIAELDARLAMPPVPIKDIIGNDPEAIVHRRVIVKGRYDFDHEALLRNRKLEDSVSGFHILTPLRIADSEISAIVDRGFIPLVFDTPEERLKFRKSPETEFLGLIKERVPEPWLPFAPKDPMTGLEVPWVDQWYRVNIDKIQQQIPYKLAPFYLEIMSTSLSSEARSQIVGSEADKRNELMVMPTDGLTKNFGMEYPERDYPVPQHNTIVPPGRHLGYVYEWAFMALMTICIGVVLQMRRPRIND